MTDQEKEYKVETLRQTIDKTIELPMFEGKISWGEFYNYMTCPLKFMMKQTNIVDLSIFNKKAKQFGLEFHNFGEKYFDVFAPMIVEEMKKKKFKDRRFQIFHEFEIERRIHCEKNNLDWIPKYRERTFYGKDFMAVVDRIDYNGDGTFTMIEYKNKRTSTVIQQMAFYYWVIVKNYVYCTICKEIVHGNYKHYNQHQDEMDLDDFILKQEDIVFSKFAVWYAIEPEENYYKKPSKISLNSMRKKMSTTLPLIKRGYFVAKPGFACNMCEYGTMGNCNRIGVDLQLCANCGKGEEND